jgi:hypothetical protein
MSGDVHLRFCERLELKLPRSTYPLTSIEIVTITS